MRNVFKALPNCLMCSAWVRCLAALLITLPLWILIVWAINKA